jgi:tetratricopeptide repeat protein
MISRWFPLTLFAFVFAPGLLYAQQPLPIAPQQSVERTFVIDVSAGQSEKMYEDIEILRRILDRKLTPLYPSIPSKGGITDATNFGTLYNRIDAKTGSLIVAQDARHQIVGQGFQPAANQEFILYGANIPYPATIPLRSLEGIYLKGQGVVYTATLSSLQPPAKTDAGNSDKVTYDIVLRESEWDSIRRQVRKEKAEPKKPAENKPPSLSDVLLEVLVENGHRFSHLGENESVTIVLTVHDPRSASPAAKSGTGPAQSESKPAPAGNGADARREAGNLAMLGELHLKQAKYGEALSTFQTMLELTKTPQQEADVRSLLAQCYLRQGQIENARAELDKAVALIQKEKEAKAKPAAEPAALPVKLIVSASKKLLDQVHEGKIPIKDYRDPSRDFYHQASVETLRFGDRR